MQWPIALGLLLVLLTFREVFQDLFHPSESGSLSQFIARRTFNILRRFPKLLSDAGPLAIVLVIFVWVALIWFGFALIYWSLAEGNFTIGHEPARLSFAEALYFSLQVITTLGLGDIVPMSISVRLLAVWQAFLGFALLTASISSVVLIHQTLGRQRSLARRISLLVRSKQQGGESFTIAGIHRLAFDLARTRVDLVHIPIAYYFHAPGKESSLAVALQHLLHVDENALAADPGTSAGSAKTLHIALQDLAELLDRRFLHTNSKEIGAILSAYARHHLAESA